METPKKRLSKYWCSVPHCQCDIRNIYIKADRFPLMLTTANKERKQSSAKVFRRQDAKKTERGQN
jgi:hypothetical protein